MEYILNHELRFRIWGLLSMYSELSFTEICQKLGKSKSTVHPHLRNLIKNGIVNLVREEKVRGNIPAKIFGLRNDRDNSVVFDEKSFETHVMNFIKMKLRFYEKISEIEKGKNVLKQMRDNEELLNSVLFLSEPQYRKIRSLFDELLEKMNKIISDDEEKKEKMVKPFHFMVSAINLERILNTVSIKKD